MLHVTNGDSVVATLRATQLGGDTLSWQDVLCEGPVPALPPADLRKVRAGFLAEHGWGEAEIVQALERRDRVFADGTRLQSSASSRLTPQHCRSSRWRSAGSSNSCPTP
jgi:hypothetical protein